MSCQPNADGQTPSVTIKTPAPRKRAMFAIDPSPSTPSKTDDASRGVRFQPSPTTIVGDMDEAMDEAEAIAGIRTRSRRRNSRTKRSPTPFVHRTGSIDDSCDLSHEQTNPDPQHLNDCASPKVEDSTTTGDGGTASVTTTPSMSLIGKKRAAAKERARRRACGTGTRFGPESADKHEQTNLHESESDIDAGAEDDKQ